MRVRKQDPVTGDRIFGGSQAAFFQNDPVGVAQVVQTRLALWLGQWFLNVDDGMPWLTKVLGKYTASVRDATIRDRILSTPGVIGIASYASQFDPQTRKFFVQATINTAYGVAQIAQNVSLH